MKHSIPFIAVLCFIGTFLSAQQTTIDDNYKIASQTLADVEKIPSLDEATTTILEALKRIDGSSEAADELKLRAVKMSLQKADEDTISHIMQTSSDEQLQRIGSLAKTQKNYKTAREFFITLYNRNLTESDIAAPSLMEAGICDLMVEPRETKARNTFESVIQDFPDHETATYARAYLKALGASPTPQAMEINDRLAYLYARFSRQPAKVLFARERIIRASKSKYYKDFLESDKVPRHEKARMELIVLQNLAAAGSTFEARQYVDRVICHTEPNDKIEAMALYYIPYSWYLEGTYEKGIQEFQDYAYRFPGSPFISQSYYYLARCYDLNGQKEEMYAVCDFCIMEFPNTESAKNCKEMLKTMDFGQNDPSLTTSLEKEKEKFLTHLIERRKASLASLKKDKSPDKPMLSALPDIQILSQDREEAEKILSRLGDQPTEERGISR